LIILIILGEEYKLWSSSLCSFLQTLWPWHNVKLIKCKINSRYLYKPQRNSTGCFGNSNRHCHFYEIWTNVRCVRLYRNIIM
jgi:hypothetical protein